MGILTDFFVATDAELLAAFPTRVPAADRPRLRKGKNPFTGEPMTIREWPPSRPFPRRTKSLAQIQKEELKAVQKLRPLQMKRVDNVKLAQLHCLMTNASLEEAMPDFHRPALAEPDDIDTVVYILPHEWVETISKVEKIPPLARKWAATDECVLDGFTAADAAEIIAELRDLARHALADGKKMYLWVSP